MTDPGAVGDEALRAAVRAADPYRHVIIPPAQCTPAELRLRAEQDRQADNVSGPRLQMGVTRLHRRRPPG